MLDTTVLIDQLRGRPQTISRIDALDDVPLVSAITAHALFVGARERDVAAVEALLAGTIVVPVGISEARRAAHWRRRYAANGVTLSLPDTLIAACAIDAGARLATANVKDFPMPEIVVECWE